MTEISILGSGVVGTTVGMGLRELHHHVIFYDTSTERVHELRNKALTATSSLEEALQTSDLSIICVPTPTVDGAIDLKFIRSIVTEAGGFLKRKNGYHLIAIKSTVVPTTTERIIVPTLEKSSGRKIGNDLGVCVNPEFLTEIHDSWTPDASFARSFLNEPIIVIGESDKAAGDKLSKLYEPLSRPFVRTNMTTAEMIKYAFNCALATRISYWNEIYYLCKLLHIDSNTVARAASMDPRIGTYGTIHGKAFGGKCLPKDLRAFVKFARDIGYDPKLLKSVEEINERIRAKRGVRE